MRYEVRKQGRRWGVYQGTELVEGGLFNRAVAVDTARRLDWIAETGTPTTGAPTPEPPSPSPAEVWAATPVALYDVVTVDARGNVLRRATFGTDHEAAARWVAERTAAGETVQAIGRTIPRGDLGCYFGGTCVDTADFLVTHGHTAFEPETHAVCANHLAPAVAHYVERVGGWGEPRPVVIRRID